MSLFEYRARLVRVIDGDTVVLAVDLGFHVQIECTFRLAGIDAPEKNRKASRPAALAAQAELERVLALGPLQIKSKKFDGDREKYGRYLAEVCVSTPDGEVDVNEHMRTTGHAVEFS